LRGAQAAVEAACKRLGGEKQDNALVAADWRACRDQQLPWFAQRSASQDLWRLSLPQTTPVLALPDSPLVEWHGGLRWVRAEAEQAQQLRETVAKAGGHATLFVAASARPESAVARFDALTPVLQKIHGALKREFDPAGIFNPGRLSVQG
jgi:glycolate oxidase FAD binding subunit